MAVNYISLPDLGTELALIADEISTIEGNVPNSLLSFVIPKFIFKGSADCSTFYLDDITSYPVDVIFPSFTITYSTTLSVTYIYRTACGDVIPCSSEPMALNGRLEFENTYGDGEYCVSIDVVLIRTFTGGDNPPVIETFTGTFEECLTQNCCLNSLNDLRKEIADCMAAFSCKINEFKCIGRNYVKLTSRYLKMSNLLWVIDHTDSSCSDYENLKCLFKKI
tara:strand:+ start:2605 stop:3270 length:666 start_codon:yes stop_codon:yes gene_type:complete